MTLSEYTNTPEFKRATATATDSTLKALVTGAEIVGTALIKFIKELFASIVGK